MPPKDSQIRGIENPPGRLYLKRCDAPDSEYKEIAVVPSVAASDLVLAPDAEAGGDFQKLNKPQELSFEFNVSPEGLDYFNRIYYESILDDMARYIRQCYHHVGKDARLSIHISKGLWSKVWYASHLVANCNPTRYFCGLVGKRFGGFSVYTEGGIVYKRR